MPSHVTLSKIRHRTPDGRDLLAGIDIEFQPVRTGLVGRNGTGKSTLLRLIAGELQPAAGNVVVGGTVGLLRQVPVLRAQERVADRLGVAGPLAVLRRLDAGLGTPEDAALADWSLELRIADVLASVGLAGLDPQRCAATLSGGERTRVDLAGLLLDAPDILLLDEPTNNLDAGGRSAVIDVLHNWRGCAIVVSHDRTLLREMDLIVELTSLGATTYGGNWDVYAERKAVELAAANRDLDTAQARLEMAARKNQQRRERQARRDKAGRKSRDRNDMPKILLNARRENAERTGARNDTISAQRTVKAKQDLHAARARLEILQPITVELGSCRLPPGRIVLEADRLTGGPDAKDPVIREFSLRMIGAQRIAIRGPNGAGKSSLLRLLTGELAPRSGTARINVPFAMLDQTVSLLDPKGTVLENYRRLNPGEDENACRAALARLKFRADAALQAVSTLSGGELLRAGLAATIGSASPPMLLILDEPTNHLDIDAIRAVEAGISAYDGALLLVSHDPDFISAVGVTRSIELGVEHDAHGGVD